MVKAIDDVSHGLSVIHEKSEIDDDVYDVDEDKAYLNGPD